MGFFIGRGALDPRTFRHATPSFEGDMTGLVEFLRLVPGGEPEWVEDEDSPFGGYWTDGADSTMWRGNARLTPNKDWRARNRTWAGEETAEHAIRVQMNLYKNHLVDRDQWPAEPIDIQHGDIMRVLNNPNDRIVEQYQFTVRNPLGASDNWHRTILCDVNIGTRNEP